MLFTEFYLTDRNKIVIINLYSLLFLLILNVRSRLMEKLKFKSKRDWLVLVVYLVFVGALLFIWLMPYYGGNELTMKIIATTMIGLVVLTFTWAVFSTYYLFEEKYLLCVSGPFKTKVYYCDIKDVKPSHAAWSSLALSLDRVVLIRGENLLARIYVSPKNKTEFIEEVKRRICKSDTPN
jgi:hypothetical protein